MKQLLAAIAFSIALVGTAFAQAPKTPMPSDLAAGAKAAGDKAANTAAADTTAAKGVANQAANKAGSDTAAAKGTADQAANKAAADTKSAAATGAADANAAKTAAAGKAKEGAAAAKGKLVDLNTATQAELESLPGVGEAYAKTIMDARPFERKDQLVSKKVLTKATYTKVKDLVIAKQPPKK